jgi:NIPSNAP
VKRCGGNFLGYYLPTKIAGPMNFGMALIDFPNLAAYETYREKLIQDRDAIANVQRVERWGCILNEDHTLMARVPA